MKILILSLLFAALAFGQRADFYKEDITFRLDSISFDVDGYYWFANRNSQPVNSDIFYPFPQNAGGVIDSVRLYNISAGQKTKYKQEANFGISFQLTIPPKDSSLFQIGYRQQVKSDSAIYILKTTRNWGKPLQNAVYKLVVPNNLKIKKFSYTPDKIYNVEGYTIYYWEKINFMPDKDMIFYF